MPAEGKRLFSFETSFQSRSLIDTHSASLHKVVFGLWGRPLTLAIYQAGLQVLLVCHNPIFLCCTSEQAWYFSRMGSIPVLEPDVASLVSSPGVGVRTPPYIPAYNHTESNHTITKTSKSSVGTPVNEEKCVLTKNDHCLSVCPPPWIKTSKRSVGAPRE